MNKFKKWNEEFLLNYIAHPGGELVRDQKCWKNRAPLALLLIRRKK